MLCFSRNTIAASALMLLAPPAFADLTAEDVWNDWKTYISGVGYSVDWQEERSGDALTMTGVVVTSGEYEAAGSAKIAIDRIVMTDQPDGTVAITLPGVMPLEFSSPSETGGTTRVSMDYRQTGLDIVASGDASALRYDYLAQTISLESTGFEVDGKILPADSNQFDLTLDNITGHTEMVAEGQRRYEQDLAVASLRYEMKASDTESSSASDVSGQIQSVTFVGQTSVPNSAIEEGDVDAMLAAGFSADGQFKYAANATSLNVTTPSGPFELSLISGNGAVGAKIEKDGLSYDVTQNDIKAQVTSTQFPLPLSFDIAQSAFNILMPVRQSQEPDDFALGFILDGFTAPETLWGLFDPSGQLPRDPASIAVAIEGKARLLFNFLSPEAATMVTPDTVPAEIESLDIKRLDVSALGASLTGNGAFTFQNAAGNPPKPKGSVNLTLTGANTLIDKLIASGLLPEQQAMGARMMMGVFAVPGSEPDTLNSTIEINEQGHVLANGQRIQ